MLGFVVFFTCWPPPRSNHPSWGLLAVPSFLPPPTQPAAPSNAFALPPPPLGGRQATASRVPTPHHVGDTNAPPACLPARPTGWALCSAFPRLHHEDAFQHPSLGRAAGEVWRPLRGEWSSFPGEGRARRGNGAAGRACVCDSRVGMEPTPAGGGGVAAWRARLGGGRRRGRAQRMNLTSWSLHLPAKAGSGEAGLLLLQPGWKYASQLSPPSVASSCAGRGRGQGGACN